MEIGNGGVRAPCRCTQTRPMGTYWDIRLMARRGPRCYVLERSAMAAVVVVNGDLVMLLLLEGRRAGCCCCWRMPCRVLMLLLEGFCV